MRKRNLTALLLALALFLSLIAPAFAAETEEAPTDETEEVTEATEPEDPEASFEIISISDT